MAAYLGDFVEDAALHFLWSTNGADGASITRSTNGEVRVYKANGVGQSTAGVTDTEDFDGLTGVHACTIDLSADAFYAVANNYTVVLQGAVIDTKTVNAVLAHFSIENRFAEVDVTKWIGTACAAPTVAGVPEVDITHIGGAAQSGTDLKDFVDTGYDPTSHKVAGVVLTDAATTINGIANDVITAAAVHDAGAFVVGSLSITNQLDAGNVLVDTTTALTGELSVGNGIVVTCSTAGKSSAKLTGGAASGIGVEIIGTGTGQGLIATGGATSGTGLSIVGGAPNGVGFYSRGSGSGSGFRADGGGGDGVGVVINGGATNGNAITITKAGTGYDIDTDIHGTIDTTTNVTNAVPANITQIGGVVQSATDLKDFVDTGYDPTSHKVAGVVLADAATTINGIANNVITAASIATDAIDADALALSAITEIANGEAVEFGTCQAGSTYYNILLALATASAVDDFYIGCLVTIVGGRGMGQARLIADYVGATRTAVVDNPWVTNPDITSIYRVFPFSGILISDSGIVAGVGPATLTLAATASAIADTYIGHTVFISSGTGVGQARLVTAYTNTRIATVSPAWTTQPNTSSVYILLPVGRTYVNQLAAGVINAATFSAGAIDAAAIAADAIDADAIKNDAITEIQTGLALEATLTAMKGVGWTTQTLVAIQAAIAAIDISGVADAVWDETMAGHVAPDSAGLVMRAIYALAIGRMRIDDITKQLILYKADNVTEVNRWNLFNSAGVPASTNIFDRQKV